MSNKPGNPFADLGKQLFPEKKGLPAHEPKRQVHSRKQPNGATQDEDASLFLSAVSHTKPLDKDAKKVSATSDDAELFQNALRIPGTQQETKVKKRKKMSAPVTDEPANSLPPELISEQDIAALAALTSPKAPFPKDDSNLFSKAMNGVEPIASKGREVSKPPKELPSEVGGLTPAKIMQEILDGKIEFSLNFTDQYMEGFVEGIDPLVMNRLRAGQYSPETHIDLHGQNSTQAHTALTQFLRNAYQRNMRTVLIITGRGKNSPSGISVIRSLIQTWLTEEPFKRIVLAFCNAVSCDGGTGAMYVMLRKYKKNRGKIHWDLPYEALDAHD